MSSRESSRNRQPGSNPPQAVPVTPGPPTAQAVPVNAPRAVPVADPAAQPIPVTPEVNPMLPPGAAPPATPAATPVPVTPSTGSSCHADTGSCPNPCGTISSACQSGTPRPAEAAACTPA